MDSPSPRTNAVPPPWRAAAASYFRSGSLCLALMGVGLSLAGPIHGVFSLGDVASPNTPLYVRQSAEHRGRVVGRVTTSGVYLTLLGAAGLGGQALWLRATGRPQPGPP
jgi:hypothetical protein